MNRHPIAVIVGSLRKDSFNRKLADALARLAPDDLSFELVRIDGLPLYNQDDDARPAEAVKRLKAQIGAAHGLLFITPEYNRSMRRAISGRRAGRSCRVGWIATPPG